MLPTFQPDYPVVHVKPYTCTSVCPPEPKRKKQAAPAVWHVCGSRLAQKPPHCVPPGVRVVHLPNGKVRWIWPVHQCGDLRTTSRGSCQWTLTTSYCDSGQTASGAWVGPGVIAGPYWLAYGTRVHVSGYGDGTIQDRGGDRISGGALDVWLGDCGASDNWGVRVVPVWFYA